MILTMYSSDPQLSVLQYMLPIYRGGIHDVYTTRTSSFRVDSILRVIYFVVFDPSLDQDLSDTISAIYYSEASSSSLLERRGRLVVLSQMKLKVVEPYRPPGR